MTLISSPRSTPNTLYSVNKKQVIEAIRKSTHTGRPLENFAFLEFAEQLVGKKSIFSKEVQNSCKVSKLEVWD